MNVLTASIFYLLPLLGLILFLTGLRLKNSRHVLIALWIALFALILHYHTVGTEIFGTYFNYRNATVFTLYLLTLIGSLLYLSWTTLQNKRRSWHYLFGTLTLVLLLMIITLISNIWLNAWFIYHRLSGTAMMQVATFTRPGYCNHRYVFYTVNTKGKINFLCPNYYLVFPSIGEIDVAPEFLIRQITRQVKSADD